MTSEKYFAVTASALRLDGNGWTDNIVILLPLSEDNLNKIFSASERGGKLGTHFEGDALLLKMSQPLKGIRFVTNNWLLLVTQYSQEARTECNTWYGAIPRIKIDPYVEVGERDLAEDLDYGQEITFFSSTIVNGGLELILEGRGVYDSSPAISETITISDIKEIAEVQEKTTRG